MNLSTHPFTREILALSQSRPRRVALPESEDIRVLQAAYELLRHRAVEQVILFGEPSILLAFAKDQNILLKNFEAHLRVVRPKDQEIGARVQAYLEAQAARKGKTGSAADLLKLAAHPLYQAAYLLASDEVDGVVAGCTYTTADVIRAALRSVGLSQGIKTLSGAFVMTKEDRSSARFVFADCGVVIDPSIDQIVDCAFASAKTFQALFPGTEPRLAFLSFSTKGSAQHPHSQKMAEATKVFLQRYPGIKADGELQFDAAIDPIVSQRKSPGSAVGGSANIFIFPDLDAGNIAYKIAQRLGGFDAFGPLLQGTRKPFSDLSRGASSFDIAAIALIILLQAQ